MNKKGFTLIELLAVIVILAIIALIATPTVLNIIEDSRKGSAEASARNIVATAKTYYMSETMKGNTPSNIDLSTDTLKYDGDQATKGNVTFTNGNASGKMYISGYCVIVNLDGSVSSEKTDEDDCLIEELNSGVLAVDYITNLLNTNATKHSLENPIIEYNGTTYNTGIRYTGRTPQNYVWFNCNPTDENGIEYGNKNYLYNTNSCEKWQIMGVFDVEGTKRVKLINTSSIFTASWDSSASDVNYGYGINQWGETENYEGADIMRLLNGYYVGKEGSTCMYNDSSNKNELALTCDTDEDPLSNYNMKPLSENALNMISEAKWYTYAVDPFVTSESAYLEENGISHKYIGCDNEEAPSKNTCKNSDIIRNNEWYGLVGLAYLSDIGYTSTDCRDDYIINFSSNTSTCDKTSWLHAPSNSSIIYTHALTVYSAAGSSKIYHVSKDSIAADVASYSYKTGIWPNVYLNPDVKIIEADETSGTAENPYKLGI